MIPLIPSLLGADPLKIYQEIEKIIDSDDSDNDSDSDNDNDDMEIVKSILWVKKFETES